MNSVSKDEKMYAELKAKRAERDALRRRIYPHMEELNDLIGRKLVTRRVHPRLPLWIHNYTPEAQAMAPAQWSDCLRDCRGLVLAEDSEIVARPFRKFWNLSQVLDQVPAELPIIQEKLDGSLGICATYIHKGRPHVVCATRGSFESEQAYWFGAWLLGNHPGFLPIVGETWLFEIIFKSNRIVVDYGDWEGGVLLSILNNDNAQDLSEKDINDANLCWQFSRPKRYQTLPEWAARNDARQHQAENQSMSGLLSSNSEECKKEISPPIRFSEEEQTLSRLQTNVSALGDGFRSSTGSQENIQHQSIRRESKFEIDSSRDQEVRSGVLQLPQNSDAQSQPESCVEPISGTREGLVLRFSTGLRVKVKVEEYVRLHRLVTQCSTRTIWELLRAGKPLTELLELVPTDFSRWVADTANKLTGAFECVNGNARGAFSFHQACRFGEPRREFAQWALKQEHPSLLFSLLDGQDIIDAVWKIVEPAWATPFRAEVEREVKKAA